MEPKKIKEKKLLFSFGLFVGILGVLGFVVWMSGSKIDKTIPITIPLSSEYEHVGTSFEGLPLPQKPISLEKPNINNKESRDESFRRRIQDEITPSLEKFRKLSYKVIPTDEERISRQKMLSDSDMIRKSYLILAEPTTNIEELPDNQHTRLMALDYLEKGLEWSENEAREYISESLENVLVFDNLSAISDLQIRKSYAGDKIEAYAILKKQSPKSLEIINSLPEDGRIKKVIKYAEQLTQQQVGKRQEEESNL